MLQPRFRRRPCLGTRTFLMKQILDSILMKPIFNNFYHLRVLPAVMDKRTARLIRVIWKAHDSTRIHFKAAP